VRALGASEGTAWIDVGGTERAALLASAPAAVRVLQLIASDGKPAANARVEVLHLRAHGKPDVTARFVSDARGRVSIDALPDLPRLHFVTQHAAHAVDAFSASTAEFPFSRRLQAGASLRGRFVSNDEPVPGVVLNVEAFVAADLARLFTTEAKSGADGTFVIGHLPRRTIALLAAKSGYLPHRTTLDLDGEVIDLGAIALERGGTIAVRVINDANQPVADAKLDAGGNRIATSDAKGIARLTDVPVNAPLRVTATADGHLREEAELRPPFEEATVRLTRGFVVRGRVADADRLPVTNAAIRVETGPAYRIADAGDDGAFALTLQPGVDAKLTLSAPSAGELVVPVAGGAAGDMRDLGTIVMPNGLAIAGRIVAPDGTPLGGARIWSPRQTSQGPLVAFMNNELLDATSAADGTFTIGGLKAAPLVLRVDAPGYARAYRTVQLDGATPAVALGDIALSYGATVRVKTTAADATARVDTRGESLDIDLVTAVVRDGVATLPHVPTGSATITVVRDRRTVCEKRVTIDGAELSVECNPVQTAVRGSVLVGTTPARGGTLTWTSATRAHTAAAIVERTTAGGLRQQQAWGTADVPLMTDVDDAGQFETHELRPGRWQVSYGGSSQQVDIPESEQFDVALRYHDTTISGVVVDRDGKPVPRAVVEVRTANASMLARDDGTFELRGLVAGEHEIRARAMDGRIAMDRIIIEDSRAAAPLRLVLEAERPAEIRIAVTRGGQPAAGAFVFVEIEQEGQRILTADATGMATLRLSEGERAKRLRLAAFAPGWWAFNDWRDRADATLAVAIDRVGALAVTGASGPVEIVRADGWNVSQLLRRIGAPPQADPSTQMLLTGLEPGSYRIAVGTKSLLAEVTAGRERVIDFE
jgi:hypothetical protein